MRSKIKPTPGIRPGAKSNTNDAAAMLGYQPQSMRAGFCRNGHVLGLVPVKLPNGRLLWDIEDIQRLLSGDVLTGGSFTNSRSAKDNEPPPIEDVSVPAGKGDFDE